MYRRSKFIEILLEIRKEMAAEADFDVDLFAEMARSGSTTVTSKKRKQMRSDLIEAKPDDEISRVTIPPNLVSEH